MKDVYQVAATGLNMRELPDPGADVLVTLPRGQFVTRLDKREWGQGWWRVEADLNMLTYQGYVSSKFVTPYAPSGTGPGKTSIAAADLMKVVPNAKADLVAKLAPAFQQELPRAQINTGLRIAHFIAQMAHESAFRYMEELGKDEYFTRYDGRKDLGNTQPGDGLRYKGRGIIQLTGRNNYGIYGQKLGLDLVNNPQLASDPIVATKVATLYWTERRINQPADADDVYTVTRRINGGQNGIDDRIMKLKIAKSIWVGAGAGV
ncbi:MAG: glycoside hydrolase family 19 protein [Caulobacterales bacterium]|jgi:putative chitinase